MSFIQRETWQSLLSDVSMCLKSKKQEWRDGMIWPAMEEIQLWAAAEQAST